MLRICPFGGVIDIDNFFNNEIIMLSLVTNLNLYLKCDWLNSTENVNWVTTADGCVHAADTTQLKSLSANLFRFGTWGCQPTLGVPSLPLPSSLFPLLPSPSLPSLRSMAPKIQLEGLGERCKLPSGI